MIYGRDIRNMKPSQSKKLDLMNKEQLFNELIKIQNKSFANIDITSITATMNEAELRGHVRGYLERPLKEKAIKRIKRAFWNSL